MAKNLLFIFLLFNFATGFSTHIVGGNFEVIYVSPEYYRINLQFYFDDINGVTSAKDEKVIVTFFDKETAKLLGSFELPIINEIVSPTLYNGCYSSTKIRTRFITYSKLVNLPKSIYNGKSGYYAVYERCCRNKIIQNILSPESTGMTFYIEQPYGSNLNNSQELINSSPQWAPPSQLYTCKNKLLNLDFSAKDKDGDSLAYFMEDPVAGNSSSNNSIPTYALPGPYPIVDFLKGYSKENAIRGNPALNIDYKLGNLSVKPIETGLFVFAIVCIEYRNGVQIGLIKREIQMLVWDCPVYTSPTISGLNFGKKLNENDTLLIQNKTGLCSNLFVNDSDSNAYVYTFSTVPKDLDKFYTNTLSQGNTKDTLKGNFCLSKCIPIKGNTYPIQIRATKYNCDQTVTDTFNFFAKIIDTIKTPNPIIEGSFGQKRFYPNDTVLIKRKLGGCINIKITDKDTSAYLYAQSIVSKELSDNYTFNLTKEGKALDTLKGDLCIPKCSNITQTAFLFKVIASKKDCDQTVTDTFNFFVKILDTIKTSNPIIEGSFGQKRFYPNDTVLIKRKLGGCINIKITDKDTSAYLYAQSIVSKELSDNYTFNLTKEGKALDTLKGDLCIPKCSNITQTTFLFKVIASKKDCQDEILDSMNFYIHLVDSVYAYDFSIAPNIFSPNGDTKNDLFFIKDIPEDNCDEKFIRFEILNRWGNVVYTSTDKNFTWDAKNIPDGQYYYFVIFEKKQFKGTIQVLR